MRQLVHLGIEPRIQCAACGERAVAARARELLQLEGKEQLARDILGEVSRPLGFKAPGKAAPARRARSEADDGGQDGDDADSDAPRRKQAANPVRKVHFASFIIQ